VPNQPFDITGTSGAVTWNTLNSTGAGACHVETSWINNLDVRFNGSVPIKGGFTAGLNTLEVRVTNTGGPAGLNVSGLSLTGALA